MQYYDFYRHYSVPGHNFKEARITFSRALEDNEQEQYYLDTTYGFQTNEKKVSVKDKVLLLVPWFFEEAIHQLFGYPKYERQ